VIAYIRYPDWLTAEIAPALPVRWYGVMYLLAFATTYLLFRYEARRRDLTSAPEKIDGFFFWGIVGALVGGRLAYVLFYKTSTDFLRQPWLIVWPFREGRFTGIQGMNYHGGLVGVMTAIVLYSRAKRLNLLDWADTLAVSAPLGYTLGRIGNFINGELHGRITTLPWGVIFPNAMRYSREFEWIRTAQEGAGVEVDPMVQMVNLPRHPSQLYEALLEGILLWVVLWFVFRVNRPFRGAAVALYVAGYGMSRFLAEYFRASPEAVYVASADLAKAAQPIASAWTISSAQLVSLGMIALGLGLFAVFRLVHRPPPAVETFDY
jgi:phosphatidylglycerol:prolipoprotein diacylglycerol transferase